MDHLEQGGLVRIFLELVLLQEAGSREDRERTERGAEL